MKKIFQKYFRVRLAFVLTASAFNLLQLADAQLFSNTGPLNTARYWHSGIRLTNGKVLVAGGYISGSTIVSSAELYDPSIGVWTNTGAMNTARNDFTATLLPDGKVLVVGGNSPSGYLSSAELYDPVTGTWTTTGAMHTVRVFHTAALLPNGKVLVVGGQDGGIHDIASSELYDPATGVWTLTGALNVARQRHTETLLANGKVLVAAGSTISGYLLSAELYDPLTGIWTLTEAVNANHSFHTATLLTNGNVLVTGGYSGNGIISDTELFDPSTGAWTLIMGMSTKRAVHNATLLPNGKVIVIGGITPTGDTSSAELFDPIAGTWTAAAPMNNARDNFTATLLSNGKLLVAGGYSNGSVLSNAELYGTSSDSVMSDLNDGLIAHYPFNGNANDASGNGNHGVGQNITATSDRFGNANSALLFNGSSSDVEVANIFSMQNEQTITVWVNPATVSGYQPILEKTVPGYGGEVDFQLRLPNNGNYNDGTVNWVVNTDDGSTGTFAAAIGHTTLPLGRWSFVTCVINQANNQVRLYVNGVLDATGSMGGRNVRNTNRPFRIGKQIGQQANFSFNGSIDDVRIYNRTLSALEILALYFSPITVVQTNRIPTTAESTPAYFISVLPQSQLEIFAINAFTTNSPFPLNKNKMTVVMTHGWNSNPNEWATNMARLMIANLGATSPNIVAWNWRETAKANLPGTPAAQTHDQGIALGQALTNALGTNYSKQIHFIGHSLGTLVNANAADYLHGNGFAWTNTQMTLFDEAEAATGISSFGAAIETLIGMNGNPLLPKPFYYHPLPKQFRWADNYVAAFGLLHPEAANVILTNDFPANASTVSAWVDALTTFHGYPMRWYDETIQTDISMLGFLWSFERSGWFSQAPATNSVYAQATSEWNLTPTNWAYGTNLLNARYQAYRNSLAYAITGESPGSASVNGYGSGQNIVGALPAFNSFIFSLLTTPANNSPAPQIKVYPLGATPNNANSNMNIPAYAWMPLAVPANAISMSFDYKIQGDWQNDSLAAAFNGTNILSLPGSQIETNVLFSSGVLDVSAFAGQTNEFFIGIVGGTSTNAQVTVQNLAFSISSPPVLQAQASGNNFVLSWPLSAANYILQTSTNLADTNSWAAVTDVPEIKNLENTITNQLSGGVKFYRLKK